METRNAPTKDDKAAKDADTKARAGTKEGEPEAPPVIVGYPDRSEIGQTEVEAAANKAANDKVTAENQRMADEAAKANAGGPAAKPAAKSDDDEGEDSAARRRAR